MSDFSVSILDVEALQIEKIMLPVLENDNGIRPAGKPDECYYCNSKVGEIHKTDCVIIKQRVKVKYTYEIEIDVPHHWDPDMILFHRNDSTWCASNGLRDIERFLRKEGMGCPCPIFSCSYIETVDNKPSYLKEK